MDRKQGLVSAPAPVPASPPAHVGPDVTGGTLGDFVNTPSGPQENLGVTIGKNLRDVVPAMKTAGKAVAGTVADVATVVPRSIAHVGGNIVAGYKGEPGNNDFNLNPITDKLLADQQTATPTPSTAAPPIQIPKPPDTGVIQSAAPAPASGPSAATASALEGSQPPAAPAAELPVTSSLLRQVGTEGGNIGIHYTPEDIKLKGNLEQINKMIASGVQPTAEQAQRIQTLRQAAGYLRGGTDRVPVGPDGRPLKSGGSGGLSVQFDSSVSPGARAAFLADPVRPTAQIDRYNNAQSLRMVQGMTQGQVASRNADKIINGSGPEPKPMGWKSRLATNLKAMELESEERRANSQTKELGRRNDISGKLADAQIDHYETESAINKGKLEQADQLKKLQSEFLSPNTDPQRKKQIATDLMRLNGKEEKQYTGDKPHYVKPEFDKKGKQQPGTGRYVYPPGYLDSLFGEGFDPNNATPEQNATLLDLYKNDPDTYKALKGKTN